MDFLKDLMVYIGSFDCWKISICVHSPCTLACFRSVYDVCHFSTPFFVWFSNTDIWQLNIFWKIMENLMTLIVLKHQCIDPFYIILYITKMSIIKALMDQYMYSSPVYISSTWRFKIKMFVENICCQVRFTVKWLPV